LIMFTSILEYDIKDLPAEYVEEIHDFTDLPREAKVLEFLSEEFWQVLDQCYEARAPSKDYKAVLKVVQLQMDEIHKKDMAELQRDAARCVSDI